MINIYDQVPSIYVNASRDFQYLSWLINIVLNSVKHNVDDLYYLPSDNADPRLAELLAMTLGFKVKRHYDQKQLAAIVSILPRLLKYKGSEKAIKMAGEALINAAGSSGTFHCEKKGFVIEVLLPKDLVDTALFRDLLPYILPAGMTCHIIRKTVVQDIYKTELSYSDLIVDSWVNDLAWDNTKNTDVGLAGLYEPGANEPEFYNYHENDDSHTLIPGLMINTVIPVLEKPYTIQTDSVQEEQTTETEKEEEANT